ncbi:hypothetical protein [Undibacterium sp. Dicai25W]|uniref:hypothetical protein n=1 Tax=Undibacterium sp. Dicai25W TaxID=3413034 RepID=UPI003BF50C15
MSFDDIPKETLEVISLNPDRFGFNIIYTMAAKFRDGKTEEAHKTIVEYASNEKLTVDQALEIASGTPQKSAKTAQEKLVVESTVKDGTAKFAQLRSVDKTLRIEFSSEDSSEDMRKELTLEIELLIREFVRKKSVK